MQERRHLLLRRAGFRCVLPAIPPKAAATSIASIPGRICTSRLPKNSSRASIQTARQHTPTTMAAGSFCPAACRAPPLFTVHFVTPSVCLSGHKKNRLKSKLQPVSMQVRAGRVTFPSWPFLSLPCGQPERQPSAWQLPFPPCCWWKRRTWRTPRGRGRSWSR